MELKFCLRLFKSKEVPRNVMSDGCLIEIVSKKQNFVFLIFSNVVTCFLQKSEKIVTVILA